LTAKGLELRSAAGHAGAREFLACKGSEVSHAA
jgi:hypothetical protein